MFSALLLSFSLLFSAPIGAFQESQPVQSQPTASAVHVPTYPNTSCPIMGKPISAKLFTDTDKGRIYVCCKSCIKDIRADVETAYRTAYPSDKKLDNKACPVTGREITKDSPKVVLQGFEFFVHASEDVTTALDSSQIVLAKLNDPALVDLDNKTCPVTGQPVAKNTFVVIQGTIVRLSSAKLLDEIATDPLKVLAKAEELRAQEDTYRSNNSGGTPKQG